MGNELKATRTKSKLKPKTGFEYTRLPGNKGKVKIKLEKEDHDVKAVGPDGNPLERSSSFKLRGGTGKIDSYGALQRQGLISPMHVEDPPKKKGKSIMDMSNAQIYRMSAEGKFGPEGNQSMKLLLNSPRGEEFSKFKTARDKEVFRKTDAIAKEKYRNEKASDETDQQKAYGEDDSFKKQTQQAGKVFDAKGDTIYPGMKGHTEAYLKTKAEGHGVSKDVLVKRL